MNEQTATYCPEDDKLRLYVGRVPRDEYLRLKEQGWQPLHKQRETGGGECRLAGHRQVMHNGASKGLKGSTMNAQATKHTPGPWRVGDAGHTVFGPPNGKPAPQVIATGLQRGDAALIAAAPDLLALASRGASLADAVAESAYNVAKHVEDIRRLAYWALDARSALRAAEGEG